MELTKSESDLSYRSRASRSEQQVESPRAKQGPEVGCLQEGGQPSPRKVALIFLRIKSLDDPDSYYRISFQGHKIFL